MSATARIGWRLWERNRLRPGAAAFTFVATGWLAVLAAPVMAQDGIFGGMQVSVESVFSKISTTVTFGSGAITKTETTNVSPTLRLNMNTMLYPHLRLSAGGVFELNKLSSRSGPNRTNSTITRNRPFFLLRSTNPVLSPGVGYFRREGRSRTAGQSEVKLVNDEYSAYLGWRPEGGPRSDFQFVRTHAFDGERAFQDVSRDFGSVVSGYEYRNLGLSYRGSYIDTNNRIGGLKTRQASHGARADYSQAFIHNRLLWNATYLVSHQEITTLARGTEGEVALPVAPFGGLAVISDTPMTATLSPNGALIDGNLTAGAGINLGLPATPADAQLRNIGIDMLTPTEVNRFLLWVDRELPVEVTSAFSWDIYSSTDNVLWTREATVPAAPFGTFESRFEIDFPAVTARYVMVVTRPLSAAVPDSSRFQDILVTEMQAFVRRPAQEVTGRLTQDTYRLSTDVRMRLLDAPALYYEGYYLSNETRGLGTSTDTLSNGVSLSHSFGRVLSVFGRVSREQGTEARGDRVADLTSATLTLNPIPTFRSSVLYSGQDERIAGRQSSRKGLFIQNAAQPYRGIDVLFGIGWTSATRETGEESRDRLVNVSATIVPRQRVSLTLVYNATTTDRSGVFVGDPRTRRRRSYASVAIDPIQTLHLVLGGEVIATTGQATRTTINIATSWAPFRDGTLQFVFAYNEALRALEFGKDRNTVGAVRWNLARQSYVDISIQKSRSANVFLTTESRVISARVRLFL